MTLNRNSLEDRHDTKPRQRPGHCRPTVPLFGNTMYVLKTNANGFFFKFHCAMLRGRWGLLTHFFYISYFVSLHHDLLTPFLRRLGNLQLYFCSNLNRRRTSFPKMGGKTKGKSPADSRKPKHSNDQSRANKKSGGGKDAGMRDASTVRSHSLCSLTTTPHTLNHAFYTPPTPPPNTTPTGPSTGHV